MVSIVNSATENVNKGGLLFFQENFIYKNRCSASFVFWVEVVRLMLWHT
jgi:hypothetical protein